MYGSLVCHLTCVIREADCLMYTPVLFTVEVFCGL
jgi:hypothetical protein